MVSAITYAVSSSRVVNITIHNPTAEKFKKLYDHYPNTLKCPCSSLTVQYDEFANFQVTFHEVCQNLFISQEWINEVYAANVSFIPPDDVRTIISNFWQLVRSFCSLAKSFLIDANSEFNSNNLVSLLAQPQFFIEANIYASLNFTFGAILAKLKRYMLISREATLVNQAISSLGTNYFIYFKDDDGYLEAGANATSFPDGCSCEYSDGCLRPAMIFEGNEISDSMTVPGIMFNCLPLDATLSSSFECFYDSWCLSLIQNLSSSNMRLSPLNGRSRFERNTTLMILINELMIEDIIMKYNFSSYYSICNPRYCTYSYTRRFDLSFVIAVVSSAFSAGLLVLKSIAPFLVKLAFIIIEWRKNKNSTNVGDNHQTASSGELFKFCKKNIQNSITNIYFHINIILI
ncbi:unnamed protein product [Rotaria sp. Silwood2]|nr:unnamed protein product [Rotaria sp. Silwood2]